MGPSGGTGPSGAGPGGPGPGGPGPSAGGPGHLVGTWRRLPDLGTRLTPIHLVNHCGSLYLVGWQPARQNFILKLDLHGEKVDWEEVVNGLEGVWSQGVHLREALVDKL